MQDDLIRQLGYANLDTRLKRISDKMSHSLRAMYRSLSMDTEPNWYLILFIVKEHPKVSVMEIANKLKFTHQSVINMTNKMIVKGYLDSAKDPVDKRKTVFKLTKKAVDNLPQFTKIWEVGKEVMFDLLDQQIAIMNHLEILELNLEIESFGERIANRIKEMKK